MTTIAYRDGVVAADTQCTDSGLASYKLKLYKIRDSVIAITGDVYACHKFIEWFKDQSKDKPEFASDDDFECLIFKGEEMWGVDRNVTFVRIEPLHGSYIAFGSGRDYAIGAMRCGSSAKRAVEIAAEFDVSTGGEVTFLQC